MEEEIWLPITKMARYNSNLEIVDVFYFDGKYQVSNLGRFKLKNGRISKTKPDKLGYITVKIDDERFKLQQVIMQTFEPNGVKNGVSVDHIDRNPTNNSLSNLRWATKEIQCYNRENKEYKYKKVKCLNNGLVYNSCQDAEILLGLTHNTVARVARGERKSIHGFRFVFERPNVLKQAVQQELALV